MRRIIHAILHVTPELKIAPADIYSETDSAVQQFGLDETEKFFTESRGAAGLARAMSRFLNDPEATRALKKGYHVKLEQRARILALRLDPPFGPVSVPNGWHPTDRRTADAMIESGLCPAPVSTPIPFLSRVLLALSPLAWGLAFIGKALVVLVFSAGRPVRQQSLLAAHGFLRPYIFEILAKAIRQRRSDDNTVPPLVIVNDASASSDVDPEAAVTIEMNDLTVPPGKWLAQVVLPGLVLLGGTFWAAVRNGGDARVLLLAAVALRQAYLVLPIWKIAFNIRFRFFLDIVEYNEVHILKGIVFRKFGGRIARWPTSSIDSPGSITSYLGYDLFLSPGTYQPEQYGATWAPSCKSVSVGFLHKDPRFGSGTDVSNEYETAITDRLERGKKLIVLFGSSDASTECFGPPMADMLASTLDVISGSDEYFVVIKPKGRKGEYLHGILEKDPRLASWIAGPDVISVHYDETDTEVCGAGWLIDRMTIGIGNAGTVMTEALAHARPYIAYYPIVPKTAATRNLIEANLLHNDIGSFGKAMTAAIRDPGGLEIPVAWIRENFDPFDDEHALGRVLDAVLGSPEPDARMDTPVPINNPVSKAKLLPTDIKESADG